MKTQAIAIGSEGGSGEDSPFAGKAAAKGGKGGISFGRILSQSSRALAGQNAGGKGGFAGQADVLGQGKVAAGEVAQANDDSAADGGKGVASVGGMARAGIASKGGVVNAAPAQGVGEARAANVAQPAPDKSVAVNKAPGFHGSSLDASPVARAKSGVAREGKPGNDQGNHAAGVAKQARGAVDRANGRHVSDEDDHAAKRSPASDHAEALHEGSPHQEAAAPGGKGVLRADRSVGAPASFKRDIGAHAADELTGGKPGHAGVEAVQDGARDDDGSAKAHGFVRAAKTDAKADATPGRDSDDPTAAPRLRILPRKGAGVGDADDAIGDGRDLRLTADVAAQAHDDRKGRHAADDATGKNPLDPNAALAALQAAGMLDFRMPLLQPGGSEEDLHGAGGIAGTAGGVGDAAANLINTLRAELDRLPAAPSPTFTLPPPATASPATGNGGDVPVPTPPPGAVLAPAELGMLPDDPALNVAILSRAAHLSIEGQDGRSLELHVRLLPEGAEIRANGELAPLVKAHVNELGAALSAEGVTLNRFEMGQDTRHGNPHDARAQADDGDAYRPVAARRVSSHSTNNDSVIRASDGRIHVKA